MKLRRDTLISIYFTLLAAFLLVLAAFFVSSCTQAPLKAPQSSAVEGGFRNIESSVSTAEDQRRKIAAENAKARAKLERIHDKEIIEIRYREYRAQHPKPLSTP